VLLAIVAPSPGGARLLVEPDGVGWRLPSLAAAEADPGGARGEPPREPGGVQRLVDLLGATLVGTAWGEDTARPAVQVGYLREVHAPPAPAPSPVPDAPRGRGPRGQVQVVLRRTLERPATLVPPAPPAQWTALREGVAILSPEVAPLLR
jgi:hypothetical protein